MNLLAPFYRYFVNDMKREKTFGFSLFSCVKTAIYGPFKYFLEIYMVKIYGMMVIVS